MNQSLVNQILLCKSNTNYKIDPREGIEMAAQAISPNLLLNKGTIAAFGRETDFHHSIVNRIHEQFASDHELNPWAPICGPLKHEGLG